MKTGKYGMVRLTFGWAIVILGGLSSLGQAAEPVFVWVKNPLVVEVDGCKKFCVGVYRNLNFKPVEIGSIRSEANFVACEAVGDGTVCPGATDCKKVGFKLNSADTLEADLKAISQPVSEKHSWVGHPVVFTPSGCTRNLCGGADELEGVASTGDKMGPDGGRAYLGYSSPVCAAKGESQCPAAVNCSYEQTPGAKLLRLTQILQDGAGNRSPASVGTADEAEATPVYVGPTFLETLVK